MLLEHGAKPLKNGYKQAHTLKTVLSLIHHNLHRKQFNSIQWWLIDSLIHSQDYVLVLHLLLHLLNCFVATNYGKDHLKKDHVSTSLPLSPPCLWPMTIKMRCAIVLRLANDPWSSRCAIVLHLANDTWSSRWDVQLFSALPVTHDYEEEKCDCSLVLHFLGWSQIFLKKFHSLSIICTGTNLLQRLHVHFMEEKIDILGSFLFTFMKDCVWFSLSKLLKNIHGFKLHLHHISILGSQVPDLTTSFISHRSKETGSWLNCRPKLHEGFLQQWSFLCNLRGMDFLEVEVFAMWIASSFWMQICRYENLNIYKNAKAVQKLH